MNEQPMHQGVEDYWHEEADKPMTYRDWASVLYMMAFAIAALLGAALILSGQPLPPFGRFLAVAFIVVLMGGACMSTIARLTRRP